MPVTRATLPRSLRAAEGPSAGSSCVGAAVRAGSRRRPVLALAAAALLAAVALAAHVALGRPDVERLPGGYRVVDGRVAYEFDAVWRTETFWRLRDAAAAWERVEHGGEGDAAPLRAALLRHLGVGRMDDIPVERADRAHDLRTLGYL